MNHDALELLNLLFEGLIVLAGAAAIALFYKAATAKSHEVHGASTLWGIFIVGLILELITRAFLISCTFFLIILAVSAAATLLYKATMAQSKELYGKSTLWGIFIIGLLAGVSLIVKLGLRR
jgi:hypothetical protein